MPVIPITEKNLTFEFPADWQASKFDSWSFYRNQFSKIAEAHLPCSRCNSELKCGNCRYPRIAGTKGIDILAVDTTSCCWAIEIKDYRFGTPMKTIELADAVALKVRDSLAALVAARSNANDEHERSMATAALGCSHFRVILHLEQSNKHNATHPRGAIDPAHVLQRLKALIKAIDPHPKVTNMGEKPNLGWTVRSSTKIP